MKIAFTSLLITVSFFFCSAQDQNSDENIYGFLQDEIFVEGNFQFSSISDKNNDNTTNLLRFNPKVGYFLSNNLALGIEVAYGFEKLDDPRASLINEKNEYTAGLFGRYYFMELGKRFFTYSELGGSYTISDGFVETNGERMELDGINTIAGNLNIGLNYFANENLVISFGLADIVSFTSTKVNVDDSKPINRIDANLNIFRNFFQTAEFGIY